MTVASEINHNQYVGNGVTTSFDYEFRIFKNSHLLVQVSDLDGVITTLVLGTDYTVTGVGASGGKVVLTTPLATGWAISIDRNLPIVQETDLRNQGTFYAETHEDAFDYLTMLIQRVFSSFGLALKKPSWIAKYYDALGSRISNLANPIAPKDAATKYYVDSLADGNLSKTLRVPEPIPSLPGAAQRANKIPAFDDQGNPIVVLPPSGSASDVLIALAATNGASLIGSGLTVSFDTVAAMKSATWLTARMNAVTKGYFSMGDGGGATYRILSAQPVEVGYGNHALQNGMFAHISSGDTAYLEQWGALAQDATNAIQAAVLSMPRIRSLNRRQYLITKTIYIPSNRNLSFNGSKISMPVGTVYRDYFIPDGSEVNRNNNIVFSDVELAGFYTYGGSLSGINWSSENGNGVVGLRMKYCDAFYIRNVNSYGFHYGVEIKTSTKGTVEKCKFHDNIDDGLSISDGGVVDVQSSDISVSLCESYKNGFSDNNVGNSGFEVDDGPRNITFYKCYSHDNESRGFACHVHGGTSSTLTCFNIRFIECRAENNNNTLQLSPVYFDVNCAFAFSSASNSERRVYDILIDGCYSSGHKNGSVLWYKTGTVTDQGLTVIKSVFSGSLTTNAEVRTSGVSDLKVLHNKMTGSANGRAVRVDDNRGVCMIKGNAFTSYGSENVIVTGVAKAGRIWIKDNEFNGLGARPTSSVINATLNLEVRITGNRLVDGTGAASAIYAGNTTTSNDFVEVGSNHISGLAVGVFARSNRSMNVHHNCFENITSQVLSNTTSSSTVTLFQNNIFISCAADGAGGADSSTGNIAKTF